MATIRVDIASEDSASSNILSLRRQITDLNAKIAENNSRVAQGTAEERRKVAETNRGIRAEAQLLRVQQQRQAIALAGLRQETGLLAQNRRQTQLLTRVTRGLGGAFGAVAGVGFGAVLLDVARGSVQASVRVEGFRRSLTALYGDAQIAERELDRLREVAQLPGITFEGAVAGALRLKTVGREGADAAAIITEFSNANALAGGTTQEFGRAMVGLTQILSRGKLSQEELNQVLENVPLIGNSIREAFGSIDAENIRAQLSSAGQDVNDFVDILTNQLSMGARASADSTANAFSNLQNATFELSAAFGDILSPAVNTATRGLTSFINRLAEAARGEDEFVQASELFTASLAEAEGNTENTNAAIQAYIDRLTELRTEQENLRDDTPWWRYAGDAPAEIERLTGDIELFTDALKGVPGTQDRVREAFEAARTAYQNQIGVVVDLTDQLENNRLSAGENNDAYEAAQSTLVETRTRFEELLGVMRALGLIDLPQTTDDAADSTAKLGESASEATQVYRNFTREIDTARDNVDRWQTALENASTEAEATEAYDNLMQSIMDLTALSRADAEQRTDATALYQAERDEVKALSDAQELHGRRLRGITGDAADAAQAQRQLRAEIHAARVAADTSAETGAMYAGILSDIASVSQRRAFVAIVERFQEQGLSLREALEEAERYIPVLQQRIPDAIETASGSLRDFSIASQDAFQASSDSVVNLTGNIIALGGEIREVIREAEQLERLDFSDVNASLNEQRYFQQNPGRDVIGEDQRAAGQQGRAYILQNFPEQAAELGITPQTLGEATRATQQADQATQDYVGTLNRSVDAVDQLTPVIEGIFGVDISNPRSGGHLAVDTAQGVGQVLSGNPIGGIATLIRSFYEWGQPDAEALAEQHRQALERERQRIATIQAELDAYDRERENLFAARLDFLRSGESTFSDWTDTLKSFSDNDLVRGRQVFSEFSRAMNALNDEVNAARLGLVPLASSAAFTTFQRITAGRPAFGADLDAPTDDQEAGVVQTIGGVPVDTAATAETDPVVDEILSSISDLDISNLQVEADAAIDIFRQAITAPARTIESINEAFATLEPQLRTLYDNIRNQIIGDDGIISDAEQIELNRLGTFTEFIAQWTGLRDTAIAGVMQAQQRLAVTSQQIATSNAISDFGELVNAPGQTIESITQEWNQNVVPFLNALYDDLFAQIAGPDGFINTTEETTAFLQLGSREDFIGDYETRIFTPAVNAMQSVEQDIANLLQNQELEDTFDGFNDAILIPGQTIEGLTQYWDTNVVPTLREVYDGLRAQIIGEDGVISPTELRTLIQRGLNVPFEDWVGQYEDGVLTPGINRLQSAAQIIRNITQSREQDEIIGMFNSAIEAPGQTIEGLNTYWNDNVVPVLETTYNQLRADVIGEDGIISPEEAATLAQRGLDIPFEDWITPWEDNVLSPGIQRLMGAAQVIASIGQERAQSDIIKMFNAAATAPGATIESINMFWVDNVVPVLETTYNGLRADIIGEDGLISPEEAAELARRGLDIPFEDWDDQFETGIRDPAITNLRGAISVIASITQQTAQSNVFEMFKGALEAPGATIESVTTFWNENVTPVLMETYNGLRAEIIGEDGLISPQEAAQLAQRGLNVPFEDWESNFRDDILTPGIDSLTASTNIITGVTNNRQLDGVITGFNSALEAPGATVAGVTQYWIDNVDPVLMEVYNFERGLIIGEDGLISPSEAAQLAQAGLDLPFTDWSQRYRDDILTPGVARLSGILTTIGTLTQGNTLTSTITGFKTAAEAPGATVAGITTYWQENVDPVLMTTYNGLRDEIIGTDGLISPSELLQLIQAGLNVPFEDWAERYEMDIFTPAVNTINAGAEYLQSTELQTGVDTAISNFKMSAEAPGATLAGLTEAWNTNVVPALRNLYAYLLDEIEGPDGIINTAVEQADLLQLGTEEEFIAGFGSDIFTPVTQAFQSRQQGSARRADRFNIRQARFNLGGATSEGEFDTLFGVLQTAVNDFYDGEERRIRALGLSVEETTRLIDENDLNRREELRGLERITNTFAEDRIDTEMRVQMEIEGLRDDALDNEQRRQQRLVDLEQDTQNRILDIQRNANRSREDIERDFQDAYQDIQRQRVFGEITDEEASSRLQELGRERLRDLRDIDIRTGRRQEDVGIRQGRSVAEIEATATATATAIREALAPLLTGRPEMSPSEMAMAEATTPEASAMTVENTGTTAENTTEISDKLDPITQISDYNADILGVLRSSLLVHTRSAVNLETLVNVARGGETARDQIVAEIESFGEIVPDIVDVAIAGAIGGIEARGAGMAIAGAPVETRMMMAGEPVSPQAMEAMNVSISAQNVSVNGGNVGGGGEPPPIMIENRTTVELDGDKVGQSVGNKIVQQGANRRNLLGQND